MFKECNVKYTAWYKSVDINDWYTYWTISIRM
jgi:hypothetical protein